MSSDPYNSVVREYFADTRHSGDIAGAATGYFEDQGIRIRLAADVVDGQLARLRFRAFGCPHVIAAAEAVCRQFEGRRLKDLEQIDTGQIMKQLAVPAEKTGRILVLEDTVRSLGQAIQDRVMTKTQD